MQQSPLSKVRGAGDLKLAETTYQGKAYSIRREPTPRRWPTSCSGGLLNRV